MRKSIVINLFLVLLGTVLFLPFLGNVHLFDWDEINFAESAREMIVSGNYLTVQVDFKPFWEKPPLFIWLQVLSMKLFGINEFAARFPNVMCGIITMLVWFNAGKTLYDDKFGWIWVTTYIGSVLPFFYFKSGIIDPWFNLFIFLSVYYFLLYFNREVVKRKLSQVVLSAFFIGLAILTKGPVAFLIFSLTLFIYFTFKKFRIKIHFSHALWFTVVLLLVGGAWFILQLLSGNMKIIMDFIEYQVRLFKTEDAGHGGFFLYHFVVLFFGVFPASVFALQAFYKIGPSNILQHNFRLGMLILFWVVLILFTIVKTKIVHYSSLCYFPLTFLASYTLYHVLNRNWILQKYIPISTLITGILFGVLQIVLSQIRLYKDWLINTGWIDDQFAVGNLQANVTWTGYEFLPGLILITGTIISYILYKRGKLIALTGFFMVTILFSSLSMVMLVPKVENISQNAAISFYKRHQGENAYFETLGFKSYAHLFYTQKQPPRNKKSYQQEWLLTGKIDKPAYFVMKNTKKDYYINKFEDLKILYEKNGFIFTVRYPENFDKDDR